MKTFAVRIMEEWFGLVIVILSFVTFGLSAHYPQQKVFMNEYVALGEILFLGGILIFVFQALEGAHKRLSTPLETRVLVKIGAEFFYATIRIDKRTGKLSAPFLEKERVLTRVAIFGDEVLRSPHYFQTEQRSIYMLGAYYELPQD